MESINRFLKLLIYISLIPVFIASGLGVAWCAVNGDTEFFSNSQFGFFISWFGLSSLLLGITRFAVYLADSNRL